MSKAAQNLGSLSYDRMAILRVLASTSEPMGSQVISRCLRDGYGVDLSERAIRYHLTSLDEMGLTQKVSRRDGRILTERGRDEIDNAMVGDKIGFVIDKIELLSYQATFDPVKKTGMIPINTSLIPEEEFKSALQCMKGAFKAKLGVSDKVAVYTAGKRVAGTVIPRGYVGFATICSLVVNGLLLKNGIPLDSKFGGILQLQKNRPWRFSELIQYSGSSLDPSEIFISGRMTNVTKAVETGSGKIVANFREMPALSIDTAHKLIDQLHNVGIDPILAIGEPSRPVCEIPVGLNRVGMVMVGGLNPIAAAIEAGINISNKAMSSLIEYDSLISFWDLVKP
jgi:repressor of nif and glnA expression